jgi:hypothetical protein
VPKIIATLALAVRKQKALASLRSTFRRHLWNAVAKGRVEIYATHWNSLTRVAIQAIGGGKWCTIRDVKTMNQGAHLFSVLARSCLLTKFLFAAGLGNLAMPSFAQTQTPPSSPPTATVANETLALVGVLQSKEISESSGLAASHHLDDAWWTMNDSGHGSHVYLFGGQGQTLAKCELLKAKNVDWEAMSSFTFNGKEFLMIADVGDNLSRRRECQLYIFEEPKIDLNQTAIFTRKLPARKIVFRYQDGPRDCEAIACQRDGAAVYLVEKVLFGKNFRRRPGIYRIALPPQWLNNATQADGNLGADVLVAERVGEFPYRGVTGMAISPDRKRMVVRNYFNAHLYQRDAVDGRFPSWGATLKKSKPLAIVLPLQTQGEAVCFTQDSDHLIVTSEVAKQSVWKVKINNSSESKRGGVDTK